MIYAKVEKGDIIQIGLPKVGKLKDGRTVSGYNLMSAEALAAEGWIPYEDNIPTVGEDQHYEFIENAIVEGKVITKYTVVDNMTEADESEVLAEAINSATTLEELKVILLSMTKEGINKI